MAYEPYLVRACRMVMLEVLDILEPWRDSLVLIGGWAVQMQLEQAHGAGDRDYMGTMDVDLDGDMGAAQAHTIRGRLIEAGYREDESVPERLIRVIQVDGTAYEVPVDFLVGSSVEKRARQQRAGSVSLSGELPNGAAVQVTMQLVSVADLLVMKMRPYADDNAKMKDGYDVYQLLRHAAATPEDLAAGAAACLPPQLRRELARNMEVFFLKTKRAARDAGMMMRDFHGVNKRDTIQDAINLAERFVTALDQ